MAPAEGTVVAVARCLDKRSTQKERTGPSARTVGISLVAHADNVLLKIVATRLSAYCKENILLPEEQCGFRSHRSMTGMKFTVRSLEELERKPRVPLFMCFIDLQRAYDSVNRTINRQVLSRFGVPPQMRSNSQFL